MIALISAVEHFHDILSDAQRLARAAMEAGRVGETPWPQVAQAISASLINPSSEHFGTYMKEKEHFRLTHKRNERAAEKMRKRRGTTLPQTPSNFEKWKDEAPNYASTMKYAEVLIATPIPPKVATLSLEELLRKGMERPPLADSLPSAEGPSETTFAFPEEGEDEELIPGWNTNNRGETKPAEGFFLVDGEWVCPVCNVLCQGDGRQCGEACPLRDEGLPRGTGER